MFLNAIFFTCSVTVKITAVTWKVVLIFKKSVLYFKIDYAIERCVSLHCKCFSHIHFNLNRICVGKDKISKIFAIESKSLWK